MEGGQGDHFGSRRYVMDLAEGQNENARHPLATDLRVPLVGRSAAIGRRRLVGYPSGYLVPARGSEGKTHSEQAVVQTRAHYYQPYSRTNPSHTGPRLPVVR